MSIACSLYRFCTNICSSVGKSYCDVHEDWGCVTPGQYSLTCSRRDKVQRKVQRIRTGLNQPDKSSPKINTCRSRCVKVADSPWTFTALNYIDNSRNEQCKMQTHTHWVCKNHCVSTARMPLLTLHVHCLSGSPAVLLAMLYASNLDHFLTICLSFLCGNNLRRHR